MPYTPNNRIQALDQASVTWMESQAARIESRVRREMLAEIVYPELIYVDTELEGDDDSLVTYIERPGTGRMTPLAAGATDLPMTEVSFDKFSREAYTSGIAHGWDDDEIRRARRLGVPLKDGRVRAAYRIAEEHKEEAVLNGNEDYGWNGILRNRDSACLSIEADNPWSADNTVASFDTIRHAFHLIRSGSNKILMPDTLLLPVSAESFLTSMIKDENTTTAIPIWEYIEKFNPFTLMYKRPMNVRTVNQLSTAGPATGSAVGSNSKVTGHPMAVLYDSRPDILRFLLAEDLHFIGPQRRAWTQKYYGRMKIGGIQVFHPKAICYITNIGTAD